MHQAHGTVDLFAVQPYMTFEDYRDPDVFRAHMDRLGARVENRPHDHALVVFPEDLATFLALGAAPRGIEALPTLDAVFRRIGQRSVLPILAARIRHRVPSLSAAFFVAAAPAVYRTWYRTFSHLAHSWGATVVAGSALMPENALGYGSDHYAPRGGKVYNLSLTFGPDGRVVDRTAKVNLVPTQEDRLGLTGATHPRTVFRVGPATVGNAICYDAFHVPHTSREPQFAGQVPRLASLGATVIAQPSANPWRWDERWTLGGPEDRRLRREQWTDEGLMASMAACPSIAAGVNPQLLARLWDVRFDGASMILARLGDTVVPVATATRADAHPEAETVLHWSLTV
jgi:predicted amidohydrolase